MSDKRHKRIHDLIEPLRVPAGKKVTLPKDFDPAYSRKGLTKAQAPELLAEGIELLAEYQDRLYAADRSSVLLVLQAMDAAGKDGTIKHVMSGVNPQGVDVHSFKTPTVEELDHDFLWRCQKRLPDRGRIGIFNRSYYEETLVVRVHPEFLKSQRLPADASKEPGIWKQRFRSINDWEKYLTAQGTKIIKVFLNVSKDEQAKRFLSRIDDPAKNWKFSHNDITERGYWDDYQKAYSEVLSHTSTADAPWYVVPADKKWFARLATSAILIDALMEIDPQYPVLDAEGMSKLGEAKASLLSQLPAQEGDKKGK